jgi:16S rRNA (guanine966-N2)-methyltransferase
MRIISGKFKGHKLASFDEDHIRPTTDRVKESLFNIIASRLEDSRVLDLYSGTGSLGLEALSRGAKSVDMVEVNPRSIQIIRKNLGILRVEDEVRIHKDEAIRYLQKYAGQPYDVLLIDPPFPLKICEKTLEAVSSSAAADKSSIIIIEHSRHEPLSDAIKTLTRVDSRSYGDKLLAFYEKGENAQ